MIEFNGQSERKPDTSLSLQLLGDISLNGIFCDPQHHEVLTKNLADLADDLGSCDLRVGNLESPLWGDGTVNVLKSPRLATTIPAARCLLPLKLDVVLLANNHAFDCREKGFSNTVEFLKSQKIVHLGAGLSQEEASRPIILKRRGLKLGLLAYVGAETNPNLPARSGFFLNMLDERRALAEVSELSRTMDVVLVFLHWGAVELVRIPPVFHRRFARQLIDHGARVVAGGHAHCLQGHEAWRSGHIYYDLGNLLFGPVTIPGKETQAWPDYTRRGGVAVCRVGVDGVQDAGLKYIHQRDLLLYRDDSPKRKRQDRRLCRRLSGSDAALKRKWRLEVVLRRFVMAPLLALGQGGLKSLFRVRPRHLTSLLNVARNIKRFRPDR